ncbi:winged helix-turn-helix domain-containing protein [Vibrio aestuarianus]|uniref:Winged helix-turn-helix domain-containing protein n=1 Tax=Vibrio aestuarianus TaxID=28171 RepID=A0A9X4FGK1_9VIBR|nr:winged helix-turn-helix domain-containing protein [Vibrio aestuarianus]MDE1310895.1 winged helix-turn-helix domain-containing protein [Vibrio aestuarianus]MDE1358357.1 winged helix-turn-helix domain-containing protein [Vibrio aestuarianus]
MWVFDPTARRQLSHLSHEKSKKLKSTDSKILELLLHNQGAVVSKECILQEVWVLVRAILLYKPTDVRCTRYLK